MCASKIRASARQKAWQCLRAWETGNAFADAIVEKDIRNKMSGPDADLAAEIFFGAIRWRARLSFILDHSTFKIKERSLRLLLHSALYQLLFLERVPGYAVVDESVNLAPARSKGLVNAFLRGFLRDRKSWDARLAVCEKEQPEIYFSHPAWLIERWSRTFGRKRTHRLLEWNNSIASVFVRTNTLKCTPEDLKLALREHGPKAAAHPLTLQIESPAGLFSTRAYRDGWFYAQDPGTLKAAELLDPRPGDSVLDVCSAPGGKTTYLAQRMNNQGRIIATDADARRLLRVEENRARLNCSIIEIASIHAVRKSSERFDRILIDAPCSNTGVVRRRVDLRWKIRREEIERLARLQFELCLEYVSRLKSGGALVYSTCSLEREENEGVVERLLKERPGLQLGAVWSSFPPESGMDGGFAARLTFT